MKAAAAAALLIGLGCASGPVFELPEERTAGRPLAQTPHQRSGEITWRPGPIEASAEGIRVDFTLVNGTPRDYTNVMLRLVLRGPERQIATVRYPAGPLAARASRVVHAYLASPGFEVEQTQLELIWAQE